MGAHRNALLHLLYFCILTQGVELCSNNDDYFAWSPGSRETLCCEQSCASSEEPDNCCACWARPCWELVREGETDINCSDTLGQLDVEVVDIFGNALVVMSDTSENATVFELTLRNANLDTIPSNICDFNGTLVKLDLAFNKIRDISPIECLSKLDSLNLDSNLISEVNNRTFSTMKNLRVLSMRNNRDLMNLEPNVINIGIQNIYFVDFSENDFDSIDITNIFRPGPFCTLNISNGRIGEFTNDLSYLVNSTQGPGYIDLVNSGLTEMINFTDIGVNYTHIGKYIKGDLSVDHMTLNCDCNIYPLAKDLDTVLKFWKNPAEAEFICTKPDSMKGKRITDVVNDGDYHLLACEMTNCPTFCTCIDIQSERKIVVNCSDKGLTEFPTEMPVGYWENNNVELLMARNRITEIPTRYYIDRLVCLDLSGNEINYISTMSVKNLQYTNIPKDGVIISDQNVRRLDPAFQAVDPRVFVFGDNPVVCDCGNLWIGDWIRVNNAFGRLRCKTSYGVTLAEYVSGESLDCLVLTIHLDEILIPLLILLLVIALGTFICIYFRYELLLLRRKLSKKTYVAPIHGNDVFISVCEDNTDAFMFVQRDILPALEMYNYSVFVPWNDVTIGDRDAGMVEGVKTSRNFVIVLSEGYGSDYNTSSEFETLWKWFIMDKSRDIVIINFDHINTGDIPNRRLKAVNRVNCSVSYKDREGTLLERLKRALGPPGAKKVKLPKLVNDNEAYHGNGFNRLNPDSIVDDGSVFNRLNRPKSSMCNCKYRRCYLHNGALDKH